MYFPPSRPRFQVESPCTETQHIQETSNVWVQIRELSLGGKIDFFFIIPNKHQCVFMENIKT